jgi:hypothetical protein
VSGAEKRGKRSRRKNDAPPPLLATVASFYAVGVLHDAGKRLGRRLFFLLIVFNFFFSRFGGSACIRLHIFLLTCCF